MEKSHMEPSLGHSRSCRQPTATGASFNLCTEDMHVICHWDLGGCFSSQNRWLIQQTNHDVFIPRMGRLGFCVLQKGKRNEHLWKLCSRPTTVLGVSQNYPPTRCPEKPLGSHLWPLSKFPELAFYYELLTEAIQKSKIHYIIYSHHISRE